VTASRLTAEGTNAAALGGAEWGYLIGASAIWGASFVLIATSLEHFGPGVVTWLRIAVGTAVLACWPAARAPVDRADWGKLTTLSIVWLALPMSLYPIAQQHISSGLTGMLGGAIPLFTAVIATLLLRRLPGPRQRVGLLVGGVGLVLLGLPALGDGRNSAFGVALILIAGVTYGVGFNLSVPMVQRYGSAPVFWRAQLVATALTAPYALFDLRRTSFGWISLSANVALGAFGTAVAFVLLLNLTARAGATRSSVSVYLEATFALILGVVIRHEPIRALEVTGCAVLLIGAWLATRADVNAPA
jgi:drug/metabolite transporter (DMT)-like permease